MREIKFRMWDDRNRDMEYWGLQDRNYYACSGEERFHIMQYTGLKDKDGKEIYEGDVITDTEYVGEVLFHDRWYEVGMHSGKLAWCIFNKKTGEYITLGDCDDEETWEIIGNIYESGDLLNDKRG